MIVAVTQADIDSGIKKCYTKCPIALALKRHYKEVKVENFEVTVDGKSLLMSSHLQHFTVNFDDGQSVKPFEFVVADPNPFTTHLIYKWCLDETTTRRNGTLGSKSLFY